MCKLQYLVSMIEYFLGNRQPKTKSHNTPKVTPRSPWSSSGDTTISTVEIRGIMERLSYEHNRSSTRENYHRIWKIFSVFYFKLDEKPTEWEDRILLFAAYLVHNNKKPATVKSYISALKTVLREDKIKISEDRFMLNSLVRACKYQIAWQPFAFPSKNRYCIQF